MKLQKKPGSYVILETAEGTQQEFDIDHAERILRTPDNGGWRLPEDSDFQFDYYDGITRRANKRDTKETE